MIDEIKERNKKIKRLKKRIDCVFSISPLVGLVKSGYSNKYYIRQKYAVRSGPIIRFADESIADVIKSGKPLLSTVYVNQQVRLSLTKKQKVLSTVCSNNVLNDNTVMSFKPVPADDDAVTVISVMRPRFEIKNLEKAWHYVLKPYYSKFTSHKTVINKPENQEAIKVGFNSTPSGGHVVDFYLEPIDEVDLL